MDQLIKSIIKISCGLLGVLAFTVVLTQSANAQTMYRFDYTITNPAGFSVYLGDFRGGVPLGSSMGGTVTSYQYSPRATFIRITIFNGSCNNITLNYPLPAFNDCDTYSTTYSNICNGSVSLTLNIKPDIHITSFPVENTTYCTNQNLSFTALGGPQPYQWYYRTGVNWVPLRSTNSATISVSVQDIFGANYSTSDLGKNFWITYKTGSGCSITTQNAGAKGPYSFSLTPLQAITSSKRAPTCNGAAEGSITITSFNRSIIPGESLVMLHAYKQPDISAGNLVASSTTTTIAGLRAGLYYILAESSIAPCDGALNFYGPVEVTEPDPVTFTFSASAVLCYGGSSGSITLTASGGSESGYEYSKNGGTDYQPGNTFTSLAANNYPIKVKDSNGCLSSTTDVTVTQPSAGITSPTPVVTQYNGRDIRCAGGSDGQVTLTGASGGTAPYEYSRGSGFQTGTVFNGLSAGSYTFIVKDANGCQQPGAPLALVAPAAITSSAATVPATCFGDTNGKITITASGGTGALSYLLSGPTFQSSNEFTGLAANTYTVTIKDINACTVTQSATVTQPLAVIATGAASVVSCSGGSDGVVTLTAANGTGPYTYSFNGRAYGSANIFIDIEANSYGISVKDSKNCTGNSSVVVTSNPVITGVLAQQTAISCNGSGDGALTLTPGGGVGPYSYAWSNGSTSKDLAALPAGSYTVTIKDSKNCTKDFNRTLTEPAAISTSYSTSDYNGSNISCFGGTNGSIDLSVTGGNGGYTYAWSSGPATQDVTNLAAGSYSVTIRDSKNCPGNASVTLTQPAQVISNQTIHHVLCFGGNTGSITFTASGGTGSYEYSINNGTSWQNTTSFTSLAANTYALRTRDANNCQVTGNSVITAPADILLSISNVVNTTCNQSNGSALAAATGGVASYSYEWFNSSNNSIGTAPNITGLSASIYRVVVTDQNACTKQQTVPISSSNGPQVSTGTIVPATCSDTADGVASISITGGATPYTILWPNGQTTPTASNLNGGAYIVEVRDNTNCLALQTITVPAPAALLINTTKEDPNCAGDSDGIITLQTAGGNGTYSYAWNTGATTPALTNIAAGTYTVTVKDIKNCTKQEQIILTDPPVFTIDLGADQKICEGMTVTLSSPESGTYSWTADNGFTSTDENVQLSQAGVYTLTVINGNGCQASDNFQLIYDTNLLKADFLMTSEAHAGDTIVLIDISWPLPEQVTWGYDAGATVIEETRDFSMIRFDDAGEYGVNLLAKLAQCSNRHEQRIIILEAVGEETQAKASEKLIEHLSAYPNPSPDEVSINVELSASKTIGLELYQAESNKRVYQERLKEDKAHVKALNLSTLPHGMYILYIRAGKEIRTIKIIKQ